MLLKSAIHLSGVILDCVYSRSLADHADIIGERPDAFIDVQVLAVGETRCLKVCFICFKSYIPIRIKEGSGKTFEMMIPFALMVIKGVLHVHTPFNTQIFAR